MENKNLSETAKQRIKSILEKSRIFEKVKMSEENIDEVQSGCSRDIRAIVDLFHKK